MGKILVIAEKPSVGRDYARVLKCRERGEGCLIGDQYVVSWAIGHLIELCEPEKYDPKYKKWNFNELPIIPEHMKLQTIRKTSSQFQILKKLMNSPDIDRIICGTDSGREGELIFRYIYQMSKCSKPFDRLWVSSMTDEAITKGFNEVRDGHAYDSLYESARCRSEADWLVGINGSRAYSIKYDALLSIGRVQTPTLAMIVDRQKEIDEFVPEAYYEIKCTHNKQDGGDAFASRYFELDQDKNRNTRLEEKKKAEEITERLKNAGQAVVTEVNRTPKKQLPPQLYDLTELQRDGNRKYGFSANKVLNLAQSLYETHKLLTYPRTDSRYLPHDQKENVRKTLHAMNIPEFHEALMGIPVTESGSLRFNSRIIDDSKITDHHAIIPTMKKPDLSKLSADERKIYELVAMRLIEAFYLPYEYDSIEVVLEAKNGEITDHLLARGKVVKELGFMKLRTREEPKNKRGKKKENQEEEAQLPDLIPGETVSIRDASLEEKKTQPPKPFTEATLLTAMEYAGRYVEEELREQMEKLSLGTPATRAAIIERLIHVGYIVRKGKALLPTEKGKKLIQILPRELRSPEMTGKWERALDKIYQGGMDPGRFMGSIERYVRFIVGAASQKQEIVFAKDESGFGKRKGSSSKARKLGICPLCGGDVFKNSKAYYCSNWKEKQCKFTIWSDSLDRYGLSLEDDLMTRLLKKEVVSAPVTMPQTQEKGQGELYISEAGKLEIKNFQKNG